MSYEQTVEIRTSPFLFYLAVFRNLALLVRMAEPNTYRTLGSVWQVPSSCFAGGPDDFCTAARRASPTPVCERTKEHTQLYLYSQERSKRRSFLSLLLRIKCLPKKPLLAKHGIFVLDHSFGLQNLQITARVVPISARD